MATDNNGLWDGFAEVQPGVDEAGLKMQQEAKENRPTDVNIWEGFENEGVKDQPIADDLATVTEQTTETPLTIEDGGLDDFWLRTKMGGDDLLPNKQARFLDAYPDGDLTPDPATGELLFRKSPAEAYKRVDPNGNQGKFGDLPYDIAEYVASEWGTMAGEIGLGAAVGGPAGGAVNAGRGWAVRGLAAAFGAVSGNLIQERIEENWAMGPEEGWGPQFAESLQKGGWSLIGSGVFKLGGQTYNAVTGAGFLNLKPDAKEAIRAARAADLPVPTVGALAESGFWAKLQARVDSNTGIITAYTERAKNKVITQLRSYSDENAAQYLTDGRMMKLMNEYEGSMLSLVRAGGKSLHDAGLSVQQGVKTFWKESQGMVQDAYKATKQFGDPEFDTKGLAEGVLGVLGKNKVPIVRDSRAYSNLFDTKGTPIKLHVSDDSIKLTGELNRITKTLQELDPARLDADHLISLRNQLYDLKTVPDGAIPEPGHRIAGDLYTEVTKTLKNPKNADPRFTEAWQHANDLASKRFEVLDSAEMVRWAKSDDSNASEAIGALLKGSSESQLKKLQYVLNEKEFDNVRRAFKHNLVNNPTKMSGILSTMDPNVKKFLVTPADEKSLMEIGDSMQQLYSQPFRKTIDEERSVVEVVKAGLLNNSPKNITQIEEIVRLDTSGKARDSVRAGLFEYVADYAIKFSMKEGEEVGAKALKEFTEKVIDGPLGKKFLNYSDRKAMREMNKVVRFYNAVGDMQAGLAGGEQVGQVMGLSPKAMWQIMKNRGIADVMISKPFQYVFVGNGKRKLENIPLEITARIASNAVMGRSASQPVKVKPHQRQQ